MNLSYLVEGHFSNVEAAELAHIDAALVKGRLTQNVDDYALQDNRVVELRMAIRYLTIHHASVSSAQGTL